MNILQVRRRLKLEGHDLDEFMKKKQEREAEETKKKTALKRFNPLKHYGKRRNDSKLAIFPFATMF